MRAFLLHSVCLGLAIGVPPAAAQAPRGDHPHLLGFRPENQQEQAERESVILAAVDRDSLRHFLRILTAEPHHAGSSGDQRSASVVQEILRLYGFDSRINEYSVYLSYPRSVSVAVLAPERLTLRVREQTTFHPDALPPFNAYSPSGDVTGEVVYANFATAEDFAHLREQRIEVRGKVILARYGRIYRGLKVREAATAGAAAVILYSDPADDGYMAGDVYPKGPMRPWDGVQRGSIRYLEHYPGDPLTPGRAATAAADRIDPADDPDLPDIPCVPISYDDAQHLLRPLEGSTVPRAWQGGLPFTYHLGPGPTTVHLQLSMDASVRPIWNNIAVLRGSEEPEKLVILGGHRDAWVFGAQDPNSGSAVLLETARVLGDLYRNGWRPRRSIVIAQWDAEEYGMIGSTEWGEDESGNLDENGIVYLNFDGTVSGPHFGASAVPSLDRFVESLARDVGDPLSGQPLFAVWWNDQNRTTLKRLEETLPENAAVSIGRMGGGSDHVVFLNHLGIPSMGFGFGGPSGVYHSYYDNFDWMERFGDPGFHYHAAAARMAALAAVRLSSSDILPFTLAPYAEEILRQIHDLERRLEEQGELDSLATGGLQRRAEAWLQAAIPVDSLLREMQFSSEVDDTLNALLADVERCFVPRDGLEDRPWYRHRVVVASGYASVGLPGISGAAARKDWAQARREARLLESLLDEVLRTTDTVASLVR